MYGVPVVFKMVHTPNLHSYKVRSKNFKLPLQGAGRRAGPLFLFFNAGKINLLFMFKQKICGYMTWEINQCVGRVDPAKLGHLVCNVSVGGGG